MSSKYLRITEKFTSDLWNNSTPDLWNRGRFENSIGFDLDRYHRNNLASQMCLSLMGDGAPIFTLHFQNQVTAQMLSQAFHSAASHSHPGLGSWKTRPLGGSPQILLFSPLSESHGVLLAITPELLLHILHSGNVENIHQYFQMSFKPQDPIFLKWNLN